MNMEGGSSITGELNFAQSNVVIRQGAPAPTIGGQINFRQNSIFQVDNNVTFNHPSSNIFFFGGSELNLADDATLNIGSEIFFDIHSRLGMGSNSTIARTLDTDTAINAGDFSTIHINSGSSVTGQINMNDGVIMKFFGGGGDPATTINGDIFSQGGAPNSISFFSPTPTEVINGHNITCNGTGVIVTGTTPNLTGGGTIDGNCETSGLVP